MNKKIVLTALVLITTAIILGAFGAHALKERLTIESLSTFETGVKYQMYQGIALLVLGFNADKLMFNLKLISTLLILGVALFSISIYFLSIQSLLGTELKFLGPITPLGGSLMIIGWLILAIKVAKQK